MYIIYNAETHREISCHKLYQSRLGPLTYYPDPQDSRHHFPALERAPSPFTFTGPLTKIGEGYDTQTNYHLTFFSLIEYTHLISRPITLTLATSPSGEEYLLRGLDMSTLDTSFTALWDGETTLPLPPRFISQIPWTPTPLYEPPGLIQGGEERRTLSCKAPEGLLQQPFWGPILVIAWVVCHDAIASCIFTLLLFNILLFTLYFPFSFASIPFLFLALVSRVKTRI